VPAAELRDRRVIRRAHRADHLARHVLPTRPLNPARGPVPARIRIQKQGDQHRRVIRRAARATQPIPLSETSQIHRINRAEHRPHQMILGHPLHHRRRHQQQLAALTRNEISSHARKCLKPARRTDTPTASPDPYRPRAGAEVLARSLDSARPLSSRSAHAGGARSEDRGARP